MNVVCCSRDWRFKGYQKVIGYSRVIFPKFQNLLMAGISYYCHLAL